MVLELGEPLQRVDDDLAFEFALPRQINVPEFGAPGPCVWVALESGRLPDMRSPMSRGLDDRDGLGAPKRLVVVGRDAGENGLAGQAVGDENDTAVEPGHADAAVRHV